MTNPPKTANTRSARYRPKLLNKHSNVPHCELNLPRQSSYGEELSRSSRHLNITSPILSADSSTHPHSSAWLLSSLPCRHSLNNLRRRTPGLLRGLNIVTPSQQFLCLPQIPLRQLQVHLNPSLRVQRAQGRKTLKGGKEILCLERVVEDYLAGRHNVAALVDAERCLADRHAHHARHGSCLLDASLQHHARDELQSHSPGGRGERKVRDESQARRRPHNREVLHKGGGEGRLPPASPQCSRSWPPSLRARRLQHPE